ncbi:MAG: hypothetical protein GXY86_07095 [Firmicutes bacterium]|nr:hypothetical protein [Bacillota bacterium]
MRRNRLVTFLICGLLLLVPFIAQASSFPACYGQQWVGTWVSSFQYYSAADNSRYHRREMATGKVFKRI